MEQDGGGQEAGDQFSGVEVSVEEIGDGVIPARPNWFTDLLSIEL